MKSIVKILVVALVTMASTAFAGTASDSVKVLSSKRYVFYFKVDKHLLGGKVEVWNSNHVLVQTDEIKQSRTLVDFFFLEPGKYTVKITKGNEAFEFPYDNED